MCRDRQRVPDTTGSLRRNAIKMETLLELTSP
jgi:hypothetical protein